MSPLFAASWSSLHQASRAGVLSVQAVRISRGVPKFWPEAEAFPAVTELMPPGWMFGSTDRQKNRRGYRHQLHRRGLERIRTRLDEIEQQAGKPIAVCCFEPNPCDCHRSWLAEWWEQQTGQRVPEIAMLRNPSTGAAVLTWEIDPTCSPVDTAIEPPSMEPKSPIDGGNETQSHSVQRLDTYPATAKTHAPMWPQLQLDTEAS